jgi:AcrR family transcriptional regulator
MRFMALLAATTDTEPKRLPADRRRAHILDAATRVIARDGIDGFSLEGVAREAGVALTLPRHYFHSRNGMLAATVAELAPRIIEPLLRRDPSLSLEDRYRLYIRQIDQYPWAHRLWEQAATVAPELETQVAHQRHLLVSASYGRPWNQLSSAEQLRGAGWIAFFAGAVTEWITQHPHDEDEIVSVLLDAARRFDLQTA